jgi:hypothetical protein
MILWTDLKLLYGISMYIWIGKRSLDNSYFINLDNEFLNKYEKNLK